jgi:hypothetical protein
MADKIKLVQGNSRPALVCTITDENTGNAVSLSGATCLLKFRELASSTLKATLTGTVTNAAAGEVTFYWASVPGSLDGDPGEYEGEIEITFSDGQKQTVYDVIKFKLREDF